MADYKGIPIRIEYHRGDFKPDKNHPIPGMGWYLYADYGFIERTTSNDGEELDFYRGEQESDLVYFLMLPDQEGSFMEVKVLFDFKDSFQAAGFAKIQYDYLGKECVIVEMTLEEFKETLRQGNQEFLKEEAWKRLNKEPEKRQGNPTKAKSSPEDNIILTVPVV